MVVLTESSQNQKDKLVFKLLDIWWEQAQIVSISQPKPSSRETLTTSQVEPNKFFDTIAKVPRLIRLL